MGAATGYGWPPRSEGQLVNVHDSDDEPAPAEYVERGWAWPPRIAAESFISYGVFAPPEEATPHARLAGMVVAAVTRRGVLTDQQFVHAVVITVDFDARACFPSDTAATEHRYVGTDPRPPCPVRSSRR